MREFQRVEKEVSSDVRRELDALAANSISIALDSWFCSFGGDDGHEKFDKEIRQVRFRILWDIGYTILAWTVSFTYRVEKDRTLHTHFLAQPIDQTTLRSDPRWLD